MTAPTSRLSASLGPLRHPAFRRLWGGQVVSTVGDIIFPVAISIKVLDEGGGASGLGLVLAGRSAAFLLLLGLGGVVADRLPRRIVMAGADCCRLVGVLGVALVPGKFPILVLAALTFVIGAGEAFFEPAYGALLPAILPEEELARAGAVSSVSRRAASIGGPLLAGVLVVTTGTRGALLLDAATFAVSMATLVSVPEPSRPSEPITGSVLREIGEGVSAVRSRPWVAVMIAVGTLQLFFVVAPETVLLPVVARQHLGGNGSYAAALSAAAVGGLVGSLLALARAPRRPGIVVMLGLCLSALAPLALATPFSLWWVVGAYALTGLAVDPFLIYWTAALQREFPARLLGRVTTLDYLGSLALLPLGYALTGPAVASFGATTVLYTAVVVGTVPNLLLLLVPGVADLASPRPRTADRTGRPPVASGRRTSPTTECQDKWLG